MITGCADDEHPNKDQVTVLDSDKEHDVKMAGPQPTEDDLKAMTPLNMSDVLFTTLSFIMLYYITHKPHSHHFS
jgi:hypothetical protein